MSRTVFRLLFFFIVLCLGADPCRSFEEQEHQLMAGDCLGQVVTECGLDFDPQTILHKEKDFAHLCSWAARKDRRVSRYHRRAVPKPSHVEYMALPRKTRVVINKLAALLRMADALSRGHLQDVSELRFEREADELIIYVPGGAELLLERRAIANKGDLFEDIYGLKVRLEEV